MNEKIGYWQWIFKILSDIKNEIKEPNYFFYSGIIAFLLLILGILLNIYYSIDCFALPTQLDCCPTTIMEAGLCGCPVIADEVGGIPEILEHSTNGILVNADGEWLTRLRELLDKNYNLKGAKRFVSENFDWGVITTKVINIIEDLADRGD